MMFVETSCAKILILTQVHSVSRNEANRADSFLYEMDDIDARDRPLQEEIDERRCRMSGDG